MHNGNILTIRTLFAPFFSSYGYNERGYLSTVYCGNQTVSYGYSENGDLLTIHESASVRRVFQYADNHLLRTEEHFKDDSLISKKIYDDYRNSRIDVTHMPERKRISYWIGPERKVIGHKKDGYPVIKTLRKQHSEEQLEGDLVCIKHETFFLFHLNCIFYAYLPPQIFSGGENTTNKWRND